MMTTLRKTISEKNEEIIRNKEMFFEEKQKIAEKIEADLKKHFEDWEQIFFDKLDQDRKEMGHYIEELEDELTDSRIKSKVMTKSRWGIIKALS
jgi:predicted phage tail protein